MVTEKIPAHVALAIEQANKEGNKKVRGFVGGIDEHNEILKLRAEGKLESFWQRYKAYSGAEFESICILLRKPR